MLWIWAYMSREAPLFIQPMCNRCANGRRESSSRWSEEVNPGQGHHEESTEGHDWVRVCKGQIRLVDKWLCSSADLSWLHDITLLIYATKIKYRVFSGLLFLYTHTARISWWMINKLGGSKQMTIKDLGCSYSHLCGFSLLQPAPSGRGQAQLWSPRWPTEWGWADEPPIVSPFTHQDFKCVCLFVYLCAAEVR